MRIILTTFACLLVFALTAQSKMSPFTKVELDGPIEVELIVGKERKVEILQTPEMVFWEVTGETLVVTADHRNELPTAKVRITVTDVEVLETTGSVVLAAKGELDAATLELNIHGQSIVDVQVDVMSLYISTDFQSVLTVKGTANRLNIEADRQSVINADSLKTSMIKASADRQSVVHLDRSGAEVEVSAQRQSVID